MSRYSAKLLFQFRESGSHSKRRTCEIRIVQLIASTKKQALAFAKRRGEASGYHYVNARDRLVYFEFVGVIDLLSMEMLESDQAWFEIKQIRLPMERRSEIVPDDKKLLARA